MNADHGQYFPDDPSHRLHDPSPAGGALLDLGVYPVSFAHFVLGTPGRVTARGTLTPAGVDRQVTGILDHYPDSLAQAVVNTTLAASTRVQATVVGSEARIELDHFYGAGQVAVRSREGELVLSELTGWERDAGMSLQAAHFAMLVASGAQASAVMSPAESVAVMETLDELRRQVECELPGDVQEISRRALLGL